MNSHHHQEQQTFDKVFATNIPGGMLNNEDARARMYKTLSRCVSVLRAETIWFILLFSIKRKKESATYSILNKRSVPQRNYQGT